ncbi:MAG TPA: polyprenyl synthetase family protein [Clostridia bacterium]|nr:polyprenyl synthetase family protein [Clostridia bacterium]
MNIYIDKLIEKIDIALKDILNGYRGIIPDALYEGMIYACFGGGKRIRPVLALVTFESMLAPLTDELVSYAIALEMIHSYSLVHDDLPGMDNDLMRRGKPTVHVKFGQGMAILIGDALLNTAYEIMNGAIKDARSSKACSYIMKKAGVCGMIAGQAKDITYRDEPIEEILKIYEYKTSALFQAAIVTPAILLGKNKTELELLEELGKNLGLIFQFKDDLSDINRCNEKLNTAKLSNKKTIESLIMEHRHNGELLLEKLNLNNTNLHKIINIYF